MGVNPIKLFGSWDEGWALDTHIVSSDYLGLDIYGHDRYNNTRSEIGELIFQLKYRNRDTVEQILILANSFLSKWTVMDKIDMILPVPPSRPRVYQPANEIACAIANYYNIAFTNDVLVKSSDCESKNMGKYNKSLDGTIIALKKATKNHNILIVDDLYSSGATLNECVKALREDPLLDKIYVLTMTKTR